MLEKLLLSASVSHLSLSPKINPIQHQYWVSAILFLCFIIFVFIRIYYRKPFEIMFRSFWVNKSINPASRDEYITSSRISIFLSILFVLTLSLFIYQTYCYYIGIPNDFLGILLFVKIATFIILIFAIKLIILRGTGFIFSSHYIFSEYLHTVFLFNKTLGVILLPLIIALAYLQHIPTGIYVYIGFILLLMTFVLRNAKVISLALNNKSISRFYLFLYLCTLEILPLVVVIKVFMNNNRLFS